MAANRAVALWDALTTAGSHFGLTPVGIDAWMLLRTEKGFLHIGADTDGSTTPQDIGWARVMKRKTDFVGRRSLTRAHNLTAARLEFVGLEALDSTVALPVGARPAGGRRGRRQRRLCHVDGVQPYSGSRRGAGDDPTRSVQARRNS